MSNKNYNLLYYNLNMNVSYNIYYKEEIRWNDVY